MSVSITQTGAKQDCFCPDGVPCDRLCPRDNGGTEALVSALWETSLFSRVSHKQLAASGWWQFIEGDCSAVTLASGVKGARVH